MRQSTLSEEELLRQQGLRSATDKNFGPATKGRINGINATVVRNTSGVQAAWKGYLEILIA